MTKHLPSSSIALPGWRNGRIEIGRDEYLGDARMVALVDLAYRSNIGSLRKHYPAFQVWFDQKVRPGIISGERTICVHLIEGTLVGMMVLKHGFTEKKLCSLRVHSDHENLGLGVRLFERAFALLDTATPLLSVSERSLPRFERLFKHFGFKKAAEYEGLYIPHVREDSFNGLLHSSAENPPYSNLRLASGCGFDQQSGSAAAQ